jgi:hypothetical protein
VFVCLFAVFECGLKSSDAVVVVVDDDYGAANNITCSNTKSNL